MRAIVIRDHGSFDKLRTEDVARPDIRPDQVLLKVACAGMNHLDLWVRRGVTGHRFPMPIIPGCDMAGTVEAVGDLVTSFAPGDRVAVAPGIADPTSTEALMGMDHLARDYGIFGETRNGACAEYCDVPARNLLRMPDSMDFPEAAAFSLAYLTAWGMLVRKAEMRPGETLLVHAAGSGVSVACINIAKLFGAARIFATAGSEEKLAKARELGVDVAINYGEENFREVIKRETGKAGVDIVVDHIGPDTLEDSLASLKKGGRLVSCGSTSGGEVTINMRRVFFKSLSILGSTMAPRGDLEILWGHFCAGRIRPVVDKVFPIRDISAAHEYLESRRAFGKVVIDVREW